MMLRCKLSHYSYTKTTEHHEGRKICEMSFSTFMVFGTRWRSLLCYSVNVTEFYIDILQLYFMYSIINLT